MKYGISFGIIAALLSCTAFSGGGWYFLFLWPATSFAVVAFAYLMRDPRIFGKTESGLIPPINLTILLPYLTCLWSIWYMLRVVSREPAINQLTDAIFIGRRLLSHELPSHIDHVIDLTCEFPVSRASRAKSYFSFPILDASVPTKAKIDRWIETAAGLKGNIYIHCAEGHGRTGLFASILLIRLGHANAPEDALALVKSKRPHVRLNQTQMVMLKTDYSSCESGERK